MGRFGGTSGITTARRPLLVVGGLGLVGLALLLFVSGCGRGTMVGRQYDNLTAYYNKFYNANRAFEAGVESFEDDGNRSIDRTRYLSVFRAPEAQGGGGKFEDAIQKSADLLRESPNSKWADDALLLIGKSYFYQGNYVGAAQKFREVLALPEGRTEEARFWLARTLVTNGRLEAAQEALKVGGADDSWGARQYLVLGQLRVRREQWADAASALEQGLAGDVPDRPGARGAFLLGQVHETMSHPAPAQAAYERVQDFDPRYELGFAARLSAIELQGQHGNAGEALERLEDLQGDDKNYERRGAMALVEARIHRAQGRPDRARQVLRRALYGGDADDRVPQADAARLHYDLAVLYRDAYENFSRAAAHFDTSSTGLQSDPADAADAPQWLPSAPVDAGAQAERYRTLADRSEDVARLDSLLRIGRMSPSEYEAFVAELRRERQEELETQQTRRTGRRLRARESSPSERRQRQTAAQSQDSDAGFLFYKEPTRVQEGRQRFVEVWGDRPRVDNWRRRNAMQSTQAEAAAAATAEPRSEQAPDAPQSSAAAALDLSNIPRDPESQAKMEAKRAVARYELGNALFLGASRPDSAATWYRRVLQEDGDQPVARRALYALAEAQRAQGDTLAAQQAYRRLIERHPESVLARRARQRLGQGQVGATAGRAEQADSLYARAYARWQEGRAHPALEELLSVAERYPETEAAPRALLASAILYWRHVKVKGDAPPRRAVDQYLQRVQAADSAAGDSATISGTVPADVDSAAIAASPDSGRLDRVGDAGRAARDSGPSSIDSTHAPASADTAHVRADTTGGAPRPRRPDSVTVAAADSAAGGTRDRALAPLKALLAHLTKQYPEAPQTKRAQSIQALMEGQAPGSASASTRDEASPPSRADTTARAEQDGPADTSRATERRPAERARPPNDGSNRAPLPSPTSTSPARSDSAATGPR